MARYNDGDEEFFSHPFRALLNPRFFGPSLLTAANEAAATPTPIRIDVLEVRDVRTWDLDKFFNYAGVSNILGCN